MNKKKRIVIALGGNALGNTLPEQMAAVKVTSKAIVDLIEEGCEVVVTHGNGPQVGMINNAMIALTHEDAQQPNTPLSVCVAMSQAYIGYDLQNALREELFNRGITDIPVATMITQVRVNEDDPAFNNPSKPIGKFFNEEQAKMMEEKYGYIMKEDAGRGYRRVVASPKPAEIIEIGTIRTMVESGDLVIACGGGGIPVTRQGNHLKGASAVIDKDFASCLLAQELDADFLIILTAVEKVAINFGKPNEQWLEDLTVEEAKKYMEDKEQNKEVEYDPDMEALCLALKGEIPCKIHCTQYDMLTAIEIAKKYNVHFSLEHAWGATDYLDEIVESGCDVCYGPIATYRSPGERRKIDVEAVKMLDDRGVNVAMITDSPILSEESLYHHVGEAVREGLAQERAVRTVTINAAKVLGVEDRLGSLEEGKDADIIVMKGKLGLDTDAMVYYTMIEGKIVYQK